MDPQREPPIESGLFFRDREDAGAFLAGRLRSYRDRGVLVLGIPRGGVVVAAEVARRLHGDLDILVGRKLRAPNQPELAIGAVTADGGQFLNESILRDLRVTQEYLSDERTAQMQEARRREASLRGSLPAARIRDRTVILVDDGLATGATIRAAIRSARGHHPGRLVVAVPVGSRNACEELLRELDELVCPYVPARFHAVGQFYETFDPVEDDRVRQILEAFHAASRVSR